MINLVGKNLKRLTEDEIGNGINIKHIDVSCNQLSSGIEFRSLSNLLTLVIDENNFNTLSDFPVLNFLKTLSANKNNFTDLTLFLGDAGQKFTNLVNLSTLKNPFNPFFQGQQKYIIFRDKNLQKFPKLQTLDGCAVSIMKKDKEQKQKKQEGIYEKLEGVVVHDQKYASNEIKTVITKSVGHRFIKNNQL